MNIVTIVHRTTYTYSSPVQLGMHHLMLSPRPGPDMRVLGARLTISPDATVRAHKDAYGNVVHEALFKDVRGNTVARAVEPGNTDELTVVSRFQVLHRPRHPDAIAACVASCPALPLSAGEAAQVAMAGPVRTADPRRRLEEWAVAAAGGGNAFEQVCRLSQAINGGFSYARRESMGTQSPLETLSLGTGTCRDFAYMLVEASRLLGHPARFASGYLYNDSASDDLVGGYSTHAWAQVHLPGAGWVDFDPTNDIVGGRNLIVSSWVMEPSEAVPVSGSYYGLDSAMEIDVSTACRQVAPRRHRPPAPAMVHAEEERMSAGMRR